MAILVTGGAGYIGSHTCVELLNNEFEVVILDNLSNSDVEVVKRITEITGRELTFVKGDIRSRDQLDDLLSMYSIEAVIHFAGLKAVGESTEEPLRYYDHNVVGTLTLLEAMVAAEIFTLVFSSSATVYGDPEVLPITEAAPLHPTNPYGRSKLMIEQMITDLTLADERWSATLLRYFNPVGAHSSGRIGEDPRGIPNNLMPYIERVAIGDLPYLNVFGDDYPTPDGTGVRDYIHVVDLAQGHLAALRTHHQHPGCHLYNLGTGSGVSVLEMREAFAHVSQRDIPFKVTARRPGDIAACWADASAAENNLGWRAELGLEEMVTSSWHWRSQNPQGYSSDL